MSLVVERVLATPTSSTWPSCRFEVSLQKLLGIEGSMSPDDQQTAVKPRSLVGADLVVAAMVYVVAMFGFSSNFSAPIYPVANYRDGFFKGVYSYRILGRDAVEGLHWVLANIGAEGLFDRLPPDVSPTGGMFTSIVLFNAICFLVFALLARHVVRRANRDEMATSMVVWAVLVLAGLSLYVITPYDLLALDLVAATLLVVTTRVPFDLLAVPLVIAGVLTRESELIALGALVAVVPFGRRSPRRLVVAAAVGVGVATYLIVHLSVAGPGGFEQGSIRLAHNNLFNAKGSWAGLLMAALAIAAWRVVLRTAGLRFPKTTRLKEFPPVLVIFWIVVSPYLLTLAIGSHWFESLRLLMPLLLCELWVRCEFLDEPDARIRLGQRSRGLHSKEP
ncbi:MAG: hypothetical protein WCI12_09650 [Actinomycetes bacterium]